MKLLELDVEIADGSERAAQPAQVVRQGRRRRRQHVGKEREGRPQAAARDAHVVQLLDVVPEPRAGLLREQGREVAPQHRERNLADRRLRVEGSGAERVRDGLETRREEAHLVLRQLDRLEAACGAHLVDEGPERSQRRLGRLDLDPVQPRRGAARLRPDRGLVECDLAGREPLRLDRERAPGGPNLEQHPHLLRAGHRPDALDRPGLHCGTARPDRRPRGAR